jgi:hypothetical protein
MITEPIKDIIDEYAGIADRNKVEYGREYSRKYGCYKGGNYTDFRPQSGGEDASGKDLVK